MPALVLPAQADTPTPVMPAQAGIHDFPQITPPAPVRAIPSLHATLYCNPMPLNASTPATRRFSATILAIVALSGTLILILTLRDEARRLAAGAAHPDPACGVAFCDSSVFWLAGRLARAGAAATVYGVAALNHYASVALPGHTGNFPFVYTPITLLPAALLSLPPLPTAYLAFSAFGIATFIVLLRWAGLPWRVALLGLASPAALWSLYLGQFGLLCGALLLAGLARLPQRPAAAGALLGLLACKPPYAFAAPFAVLAGRHWRALAAGAAVLAALATASLACFGTASWTAFFGPGRAVAAALLITPFQNGHQVLGVSLFWMLRSLGAPLIAAAMLQAAAALAAARLLVDLWSRPAADTSARLLASLCLVLLATPYAYTDDMVALSAALPLLWRADAPLANAALAVVWLSPAATGLFLKSFGFLPEPILVAATCGLAWVRWSRSLVPKMQQK